MTARTSYCPATSLDGFIADPDDSLGRLLTRHQEPGGPMDYEQFIAGIGAIAMGATTYRWVQQHGDGTWPYAVRVGCSPTMVELAQNGEFACLRYDAVR